MQMRALRLSSFSGMNGLAVENIERPAYTQSEVLIEVRAASINPSDVKNTQGLMHGTTLPRTPGRDFAGVVLEGPRELLGQSVWGTAGEIGYTIDGSHAEYTLLPASSVSQMPVNLSFAQAAAAGVAFVTAWSGLHDVLRLESGETIVISGALGAVGSAVTQLSRWLGATTIGLIRREPDHAILGKSRPDHVIINDTPDLANALRAIAKGSPINAVYDTVGQPVFAQLLEALGTGGRYAMIANTGEKHAALDIVAFYRKRLTLGGVDSRAIDATTAARILDRIRLGFESGALEPPTVDQIVGLSGAREAYAAIANGASRKIVIDPKITE